MLEVIRSVEGLESIAAEWEALCDRVRGATVFQLPQWLLPWWRHFGGGEIFTPVLREQGRLVAIAPLFLHGMPGQQIRQISFIGVGITDYLDFIVDPEFFESFPQRFLEFLDECKTEWDVCNLEELPPGANARGLASSSPLSNCFTLGLPSSVSGFYAKLEPTHRRNVRTALKKFDAAGVMHYEAAALDRFDDFVRLHSISWQDRGETGVVQTETLQRFYRESAEALARKSILRVHTLVVDEKPVATVLAYHFKLRGYAYLGGFDPAFKKFSPGTAIMALSIERAILEELDEWDFLRGDEPYKSAWRAQPRSNHVIRLENR